MSLPHGAVAWSVIVAFSCPSHVPWGQVSASGPLVVFCCRVAVLYVSSSRCRGLVCDCGIFMCLSCPLEGLPPYEWAATRENMPSGFLTKIQTNQLSYIDKLEA